jgi:hypothetical protein
MGWPRPITQQSTTISMTALTPLAPSTSPWGQPGGTQLTWAWCFLPLSTLPFLTWSILGRASPHLRTLGTPSFVVTASISPSSGLCPTHTDPASPPCPQAIRLSRQVPPSSGWGPQGCSGMCERHKRAHLCNHLPQRTGHLGGPYPNRAANAYAGVTVAVGRAGCGGAPAHSRAVTSSPLREADSQATHLSALGLMPLRT